MLAGKSPTASAVTEIGASFKRNLLPERIDDFINKSDERAGLNRLHLLVICSANLESYLQDAITLYVGGLGYAKGPRKLNDVGEAIAAPVIKSSTVPSMMKYIQELLCLTFGQHLTRWQKGYKLRCGAAHNGGIVTSKVLRDIPDIKLRPGRHG
jgi:hypothetical protein